MVVVTKCLYHESSTGLGYGNNVCLHKLYDFSYPLVVFSLVSFSGKCSALAEDEV